MFQVPDKPTWTPVDTSKLPEVWQCFSSCTSNLYCPRFCVCGVLFCLFVVVVFGGMNDIVYDGCIIDVDCMTIV